MTRRKGRDTDEGKDEEGGKWKLWVKEEEEDTTAVFHKKDSQDQEVIRTLVSRSRSVIFFPPPSSLSGRAVTYLPRGGAPKNILRTK